MEDIAADVDQGVKVGEHRVGHLGDVEEVDDAGEVAAALVAEEHDGITDGRRQGLDIVEDFLLGGADVELAGFEDGGIAHGTLGQQQRQLVAGEVGDLRLGALVVALGLAGLLGEGAQVGADEIGDGAAAGGVCDDGVGLDGVDADRALDILR